jgi:hypothetical protein
MPCRVHMENSIRYHAKKDCMPKCAPCWHLGSRLSSALHARTHDGMMTYTHARTHEFTHARTHACTHARSHARTLVHACTPTNTHAHTRHTHCMRTRSVHGMWHEYQQGWRMACRKDCMQKEKNVPVCATEQAARPASGWRPVCSVLFCSVLCLHL